LAKGLQKVQNIENIASS